MNGETNEKMTQTRLIAMYLKEHGSITSLEAFSQLFITQLAARIWNMERLGWEFNRKQICRTNRAGEKKYFTSYSIRKEGSYEKKES